MKRSLTFAVLLMLCAFSLVLYSCGKNGGNNLLERTCTLWRNYCDSSTYIPKHLI